MNSSVSTNPVHCLPGADAMLHSINDRRHVLLERAKEIKVECMSRRRSFATDSGWPFFSLVPTVQGLVVDDPWAAMLALGIWWGYTAPPEEGAPNGPYPGGCVLKHIKRGVSHYYAPAKLYRHAQNGEWPVVWAAEVAFARIRAEWAQLARVVTLLKQTNYRLANQSGRLEAVERRLTEQADQLMARRALKAAQQPADDLDQYC